jgi:hypothetical protein
MDNFSSNIFPLTPYSVVHLMVTQATTRHEKATCATKVLNLTRKLWKMALFAQI